VAERLDDMSKREYQSPLVRGLIKIRRRKIAFVSLIVLTVILVLALVGNSIYMYDPVEKDTANRLLAPCLSHLFGTDNLGRDVLARVLYGSKISLAISLVAVLFALVVGTTLGIIAGYVGGKVDAVFSLVIDAICAFPTILLGLLLATALGSGIVNIMLAIGIANVPYFARLVRSMSITIREREYVESAITTGLNHFEIITRYLIPNMSSVIIVQTSLSAASAIITESTLSFIGVGVQPPAASWGALLRDGYDYISRAPWLSVFPGIAILVTVIALNFLGDGLRDALDVKIRVDG
jgi:peptide/nickel transport system permease protein